MFEQWISYAKAIKESGAEVLVLTSSEYHNLSMNVPDSMIADGHFQGLPIEINND